MASYPLTTEHHDRVLTIQLPGEGEPAADTAWLVTSAMAVLEGDVDVDVAILMGAGTRFGFGSVDGAGDAVDSVITAVETGKPVIAAVRGTVEDEGLELALSCDFVIAEEEATFRCTRADRTEHDLARLNRILARNMLQKQAARMVLERRGFTAAEGILFGFVAEMVAQAQLKAAALGLARRVRADAAAGVLAAKRALVTAFTPRTP